MMETEPGTVNKVFRQDYIYTNNTLSSPALRLQPLCIREPVAEENMLRKVIWVGSWSR